MLNKSNLNDKINFEDFFKDFPAITYERGEKVARPSELSTNAVYIKKGFVKIYSVSLDGREIIINIINSELYNNCLIFGIADFMKNYSIQALNSVQAYHAPKDKFSEFIEANDGAAEALIHPLSLCLRNLCTQMEWLKNGDSYYKIACALNYFGEQTTTSAHNTIIIGFKITHQMIANITGITRETVTVQLNKLREKSFIDYDDNVITIKDVKGLREEIDTLL